MSSEPILIVGGGLGGLTTALALARRGWSARVLEGGPETVKRDDVPHQKG